MEDDYLKDSERRKGKKGMSIAEMYRITELISL